MYPSKYPVLYILQCIIIGIAVLVGMIHLHQPLSILALFFLPEYPLVPETQPEPEPSEYNGTGSAGFGLPDDE